MLPPALVLLLSSVLSSRYCGASAPTPHLLVDEETSNQHVLQVDSGVSGRQRAQRRLHGRFLHITDIHPDPLYKVHSSSDQDSVCHRGKGAAGTYGAETSDCDSPHSLLNATLAWIDENLKDQIDFVVWTGDSARHDSDDKIPRTEAEVKESNRMVAKQFVDLFTDPISQSLGIPIVPTIGNNDILPHNILAAGPNKWLKWYSETWKHFIPEEQRHTFEFGGWYYVEVIPNQLAVFSLNTMYFFDKNAAMDNCISPSEPGFKQFEWLRIQLQFLRTRGMKAILIGHVPPARTESKQLWDETCWQKYTLWLRQYRDVVVGSVYGHMNIDHFLIQDTKDINYYLMGLDHASLEPVRESMDDELDLASSADYLQELRDGWKKLPRPPPLHTNEREERVSKSGKKGSEKSTNKKTKKNKKNKKKKKKKHRTPRLSKKFAERYQVSLVGPSVVPNFLPTLRVIEYNITGLEDVPTWADSSTVAVTGEARDNNDSKNNSHQALHRVAAENDATNDTETAPQRKKGKNHKKKNKKKKKPSDPHLVVPEAPSKTTIPGPAYSVQPLTWLGYTQYFANLTYINNDITIDADAETSGWRPGKHHGKVPKQKPAKPRQFEYQVEYDTRTDEVYNLKDLTVSSYVRLAYRMGKKTSGHRSLSTEQTNTSEDADVDDTTTDADAVQDAAVSDSVSDLEPTGKKLKKKKNRNELWLRFLDHAFVRTMDPEELRKLDT